MVVEKKILVPDNPSNNLDNFLELENIIKKNTIPNALLFTGNKGMSLKECAVNFAKSVNCLEPRDKAFSQIPCNKCIPCKKINADMHPDILSISPENEKIKIAAIRDIYQSIISEPNEAKMRVVIIEDAQLMNEQAQNAFLKMLEEPPAKTFFILIANNINSLLTTIISRCRSIRLNPLETGDNQYNSFGEENDIDWPKRQKWLLKEIINIISNNRNDRFKNIKPLLLAEKLSNEPNLLKGSLSIIRTFLRDLAIIRYSADKITNINYLKNLTSLSKKISLEKSIIFFKDLYETERKNQSNPSSTRLNLETFFLKLAWKEK
jgi:DNA polymerase-3 subunit delta'